MKDSMIVDLYWNRDEEAITQSSIQYGKRLRNISYHIVMNYSDAEECENDTYLSAWNAIPPTDPRNYLLAFLAKITRNISINCYNKKHAQKRDAHIVELTKEMEECIPNPNMNLCLSADNELTDAINRFLEHLPQEQRKIFVARYWCAYSIKEVSQIFHISESKTKVSLMRTRNKMKDFFDKEGIAL